MDSKLTVRRWIVGGLAVAALVASSAYLGAWLAEREYERDKRKANDAFSTAIDRVLDSGDIDKEYAWFCNQVKGIDLNVDTKDPELRLVFDVNCERTLKERDALVAFQKSWVELTRQVLEGKSGREAALRTIEILRKTVEDFEKNGHQITKDAIAALVIRSGLDGVGLKDPAFTSVKSEKIVMYVGVRNDQLELLRLLVDERDEEKVAELKKAYAEKEKCMNKVYCLMTSYEGRKP